MALLVALLLLCGVVGPAAAGRSCPAAPAGFTIYPNHCVGGPGKSCSGELRTGTHCESIAECVKQAASACIDECKSFAIEVGGDDCGEVGSLRWHTFRGGNDSVVSNDQWTAYARPGGPSPPAPGPSSTLATEVRCRMRRLAVETAAARLEPYFGLRAAELVRDAVRLQECQQDAALVTKSANSQIRSRASNIPAEAAHGSRIVVYISPQGDDNSGDGSSSNPFFSPTRARDAVRAARLRTPSPDTAKATVILFGGVYHLGHLPTMQLEEADSNTHWMAHPDHMTFEQPVLSGAIDLSKLAWTKHIDDILVADLPPGTPTISTLFDERTHRRLIRARHPNGDPELPSGMCFAYGGNASLGEGCAGFINPHGELKGVKFVGPTVKERKFNTTRGGKVPGDDVYRAYDVIWQAPPTNLVAEGFPAAVCNSGEGGGELYNRSASVVWGEDQDSGPLAEAGNWTRPREAIVHMMHNGWGNVQYTVESINTRSRSMRFERGGYQHGRSGGPSHFYIENQLELLDSQGEWYYDSVGSKLYLWPNSSSVPPISGATLTSLIALNGTRQSAPVRDVTFSGVGFGRTSPTYMLAHERPISGDWAIHRGGTVLVTNAANISFLYCNFSRTGGNALIFSRSVRAATVRGSEFFSIGDSAIVAYGDVDWETGDARARNYPSELLIEHNLIHEVGVWGKQTSGFFQGVSGNNRFLNNVVFGGPRAMININDGTIGLSNISGNVLFGGCRESHDHGNFNSWDRTPVLHRSADATGSNSWTPGLSTLSANLVLNSYGAGHGLDHDDGSMEWNDVRNVVGFSHACKGNFGSNRNCSANLIVAPGLKTMFGSHGDNRGAPCGEETNNGHGSTFANKYFEYNTCVQPVEHVSAVPAYLFASCDAKTSGPELGGTVWATRGNRFLVPNGTQVVVPCHGPGASAIPLSEWKNRYGQDSGASVGLMPPMEELMEMARGILGIN